MAYNTSKQPQLLEPNFNNIALRLAPIVSLTVLGITINVAAFIFIVLSSKIKRPVKLMLFNLVVSDFMFLIGVLASSLLYLHKLMLLSFCPVITVFLIIPSPISYSAVLGLSVYNFIAVYKATDFNVLITTRKAVIATIAAWTFILLLSCLSVAVWGRQDSKCTILAQAPPFILVFFAILCILCCVGMTALNISVVIKLRSIRSVGSMYNKSRPLHSTSMYDPGYEGHSTQLPQLLSVPTALFKKGTNTVNKRIGASHLTKLNASELYSNDSREDSTEYLYKRNNNSSIDCIQPSTSQTVPDTNTDNTLMTKHIFTNTATHLPESIHFNDTIKSKLSSQDTPHDVDDSSLFQQTSSSIASTYLHGFNPSNFQASSNTHIVDSERNHKSTVNDLADSQAQSSGCPISTLVSNAVTSKLTTHCVSNTTKSDCKTTELGHRRVGSVKCMPTKMRSTIITLIILAFWNALISLPILGMWTFIATVQNIHSESSFDWISKVFPVLVIFNAVTNPILYAWRFVEWRKLCTRPCCKRRVSVKITPHIENVGKTI